MSEQGYEDQFSRAGRWWRRAARRARWRGKGLLGAPRALLVETRWRLGDEIMALPIFESLRQKFPADHIAVLTNYPDLYAHHPFVDAVNVVPPTVDRYVLLRGAPRDARRIEHLARITRAPVPVLRPHLFWRDWDAPQLAELPGGAGPLIAIAPGATWRTKRWRPERWRELAETLQARGARVVELGLAEDAAGVAPSLAGRTTVREAACVLRTADLCVACDSGLMHLALATATPTVALFGPTDPHILIRNEPNFFPIQSGLACSGHWNRAGEDAPAPDTCPKDHACCLEDIQVSDALLGVERYLVLPR